MAQISDSLPGSKALGRWDSVRAAQMAARLPAGSMVVPARAKKMGLRPGERKLLQALADWTIIVSGSLPIMVSSARAYSPDSIIISLLVVSVLWFFFANAFDAYRVIVLQSLSRSVYAAAKVFVLTGIVYILIAAFTGGILPIIRPRIRETLMALMLIWGVLGARALIAYVLTHAPLRRRVVVVGANSSGHEMVEALTQYGGVSYEFMGYADDAPAVAGVELDRLGQVVSSEELLALHDEAQVDQIVLANPVQTPTLLHVLSICHERGIQITPMFALYQDLTGRVPVSHLGKDWFVALPAHMRSTPYMLVKRIWDLAMALLVLVLTLPLFPLVALVIKLDSPGPIFFKQIRVGRGGKPFKIVKFRSMRQDAERASGAVWAQQNDPRITRVGRLLRKSRLDELPQLWNVIVGDMSFVGPRPERPEFDDKLEQEIPFYRARRAVRPGLTGWAQVRHGYGNTMFDALRKVEYDLYYIKNDSLYLDLLILLRTVAVVLRLGGT